MCARSPAAAISVALERIPDALERALTVDAVARLRHPLRMSERPRPRVLRCAEGAELVVLMPRGSTLVVPRDARVEVRKGRVEEPACLAPVARAPDLRVQKALRAFHAEPARRFTVRELAKLAGASPPTFARAFRLATGETPGAFLKRERLRLARDLVSTSDAKLAEIAAEVGYASEFALSRAFKRHFGVAPSHFRQALAPAPIRCAA